jgi:ElaB/YqjD/DUF883 family membrane-anchored ribosome-binding protein
MSAFLNDAAHNEKLVADLKAVVADAEEILRATASQTGDKVSELRSRIEARLAATRARLSEAERTLLEKGRAAARATDHFVHEEPWKSVGIAALVGLAMGVLIGRR